MNPRPALTPYTVTLAGPERHTCEQPWTYVVNAESEYDAIAKAAAFMGRDIGTVDVKFVETIPGVPLESCGYHWNDLREEGP